MINKDLDVAFFDVDHTIINNDCDVSWKLFLIDKGLASKKDKNLALKYYQLYKSGSLPIIKFLNFQLKELIGKDINYINELALEHFNIYVKPKVYKSAYDLINKYKQTQTKLVSISGCNDIILKPLNDYFGFDHTISTKLEINNKKITGLLQGEYVLKNIKKRRALKYILYNNFKLSKTAFYADSINDFPLMNIVNYPFLINPDQKMKSLVLNKKYEFLEWTNS